MSTTNEAGSGARRGSGEASEQPTVLVDFAARPGLKEVSLSPQDLAGLEVLPELVRVAGGVVWLEVLTAEDQIIGDMEGLIRRPATWYRDLFASLGLTQAGPYTWLAPALREDAAALEAYSAG